ncbi:MAG TPA: DUF2252 domain-containing protein [Ilumatobacteraceae bacterium]|nr:DUF2252 domain-containing protein [Ilumatobacteraceae bacterium]HUC33166.1 DUF2252 domain-containing protein [Ilumatobacteraceae bacterium]
MTGTATRKDQAEDGRARRERVSRVSHGEWEPAGDRADPIAMLEASNAGRLEDLVPIRFGRMAANPFAFLRGSAAVMAADLAAVPTTGLETQVCGDCHLMNFGLFATPERNVVFGLNDFDETLPGPWEWDLKRLAASLVVASQDVRLSDKKAVEIAIASVRSYRTRIAELAAMTPLEVWYDRLDLARAIAESTDSKMRRKREEMDRQARKRVAENLFPKLITDNGGAPRIADQPPLIYHPEGVGIEVVLAFIDTYRESLPKDRRVLFDRYTVRDAAIKVVGVGSVGTRCYVALFTDDDGHPLLLQVKEANKSVLEPHVPKAKGKKAKAHNGERVVVGQHLMQPASDIFLGWGTASTGKEFYVRQLRDMKLSVTLTGDAVELTRYAGYCGLALARAHANTGSAAAIAGYLGNSDKFDEALGQFGLAYARQTVRDHAALVEAIDSGRIPAILDAI